jgi:hypothetical protein
MPGLLWPGRAPVLTGLLFLASGAAACNGTVDGAVDNTVDETPADPALAVSGPITWDPKSAMKQISGTKGCDSYMPTWAPDNNLYTAVGDCRYKGAPQKIGMGFGRISGATGYGVSFTPVLTGDPLDWDDAADGAGVEALGDGDAGEKAAGMLYADGRLWYWIRNIFPGGIGARLKFSDNVTSSNPQFTWADWTLPEVGYASFVQFGKAYANGPADYVYATIPMRSSTTGSVSNSAYDLVPAFSLLRGRRSDLSLQNNWEYFCGTSSAPAWCATAAEARPMVFRSGRGFYPRGGMSWNPGLKKFMLSLVFDPTPKTTSDPTRFYGGLMVFVGAHPWGPWQSVFASSGTWPGGTSTSTCGGTRWGAGERADIPPKYMSANGKTFYLFSSGGDCLSIARGVLP